MAESLTQRLDREAQEVMQRAWAAIVNEGDCTCHRCLSQEATKALGDAGFLLCRDARIDG